MTSADLIPHEAARGALRAGLSLADERLDLVAATANHIQSVVGVLRELDFEETAPASVRNTVTVEEVRTVAAA